MKRLSEISKQQISRQSFLWISAFCLLVVLPHLYSLPFWVIVLALLAACGRLPFIQQKARIQIIFIFSIVGILLASLIYFFDDWFSGDALRSFFIIVVILKWAEAKSYKEYIGLVFVACVLAGLGVLYQSVLWGMLYSFLMIFALLLVLLTLHQTQIETLYLWRTASRLFLSALPIMILLFFIFPRLNGPLWELGLAFGLPLSVMLDQNTEEQGIENTLRPGQIKRIKKSDDTVLVAEFFGKVPYVSRLYWRGPVYWDFDGKQWSLPEGWNNRGKLLKAAYKTKDAIARQMRKMSNPVRYNLRLLPHGQRWMYALDIPATTAPESFISSDFQLLSIRKTAMEAKLELSAYLDYSVGLELTDKQRERALAWPENSNLRLKKLGEELKQQGMNSRDLSSHILGLFAKGNFQITDNVTPETGRHSLDEFFFEQRKGDIQQLAATVVMLMRAAGVPARLVTGYRGGSIIALTNFVIVKKQNAHVWAEIWQTEGGWVRIEAKDAIVAPKIRGNIKVSQAASSKIAKRTVVIASEPALQLEQEKKATTKKQINKGERQNWLNDWQQTLIKLFSGLEKWVINYNPERQNELLKSKKQEQLHIDELLLKGVLLSILMAVCYFAIMTLLAIKQRNPVTEAFEKFCRYFAKQGVERASWECPRDYSQRLSTAFPDISGAINTVVEGYIAARYSHSDIQQQKQFVRQVKRFLAMLSS
jgi:transglutaminase-like putative cysteine protease